MNIESSLAEGFWATNPALERRSKQRIKNPFPALVRGLTAGGKQFELRTVLDNLSAGGLYLRLPERIETGHRLSIMIQLSNGLTGGRPGLRVLVHGEVLRVEPQPGGIYGLAVAFKRHRMF
ncbi:MAG TPA: PilZ domain-containing protein [Blastocatellia bacterium]|nr:PilZ domain-containing protein [Blastocatellia bacterium]